MSKTNIIKSIISMQLMLALSITLFSCSDSDDISYTTSPTDHLSFSVDTLHFDTVFSSISSSTKRFNIFNNNKKAIKIANIKLGSGGTSGFRVNVDGQYGTTFEDVDVLGKDSIFVFAEITAPVSHKNEPVLIKDSLMITLSSGTIQKFILQAYGQDVKLMNAPIYESDATLSSPIPLVIYDSLVIKEGCTLTVEPGTTLCFHSGASLMVHGRIKCEGTLDHPIVIRGDRTDRIFSYLPYDRMDAQWGGITIYEESDNNSFNYCDIHGGYYGIYASQSEESTASISISNSSIHNVSCHALSMVNYKATLYNTQLSNAGWDCLHVLGGNTRLTYCTLAQFYPWGQHGSALSFGNIDDDGRISYPLHNLSFESCIITGRSNDEIFGTKANDDAIPFVYSFANCLLNTPQPGEDMSEFLNCIFENAEASAYKADNFSLVDDKNYIYDFHLSETSPAHNIGNTTILSIYPFTKDGKPRTAEYNNAGCY